ncbi:MAG: adenylosuccinate synthetase, partial [Patescibacteria group bacterium]
EAKTYLAYLEKMTGVPVKWVSVGPERNQTIKI